MRPLIIDNFAGGGGASTGIEAAIGRPVDIAINHDPEAIAMHQANHPKTKHYTQDIWAVSPTEVAAGRPVAIAWFSPDCKHFSKAKGGKPVEKGIRDLAWVVVRWAREVKPKVIMLENVEEFRQWGPLDEDNLPIVDRKGETWKRWVRQLEKLGYKVEWRELRASDYGTPTSRKRLFVIARCDGKAIRWPRPTHGKGPGMKPYRTAAECIDWWRPCPSIFLTKEEAKKIGVNRPLVDATMKRIAAGMKRFVFDNPDPFIVPLDKLTGSPFLTEHMNGTSPRNFSVDEPLRTQCAQVKGGHFALVQPFMMKNMTHNMPRDIMDPLSTILTGIHHFLIAPTLISTGYGERKGQKPRAPGLNKPLGTVVAGGAKHALVAAFIAKHFGDTGQRPGLGPNEPLATVTASDHHAVVTSNLVKLYGTNNGAPMDSPMPTVTSGGTHLGEIRAFLTAWYGAEKDGQGMKDPLRSVTSKDRFGLVYVKGEPYEIVDIGMRMLAPRELFRAQGFPEDYKIEVKLPNGKMLSKTAQIRMCGNSVCPTMARCLVEANIHG